MSGWDFETLTREEFAARITALGESNARAFLYCTTRRERESTAKAA